MDELKQIREDIMNKISKHNSKIFKLQNELLNIEQLIVDSDHKEIMDTLTLNEQQLKVINSKDKYTLVIACPGSGKTHTLISMYIKLIVEDKIDSNSVLMITFTKKAGQEMCGRLSSLIPTKLPAYVGSLHGLSYRVLQEYHNINYTVLDEKETKDILKDLCTKYLECDDFEISLIKNKISFIIDQASSSYPFEIIPILKNLNLEKFQDKVQLICDKFKEKKTNENLIDFNDLMIKFCEFLDTPESKDFKKKIQFIFFDEYQDVNPIQHYILSKLKKSRIMVVGDDAQAIYAFRGSSVNFILNFPEEFKPNKMYLLENNYRSTKQIVEFFQDIIKKNTNQYEKAVVSVNPNDGLKPLVVGFKGNKDRDQWVINEIFKNKKNGIALSKMVILSRKNDSLDKIEIELVKQGITVIKHTGLSILDKSHVKDFLAFLTVLVNDKSSIHWKRILSLQLGVNSAHELIEKNGHLNFLESIRKLKDTQVSYANYLKELDGLFIFLNKSGLGSLKDVDKGRYILSYLEKIWGSKNKFDSHLEEKIRDINLLLSYLSGSNLKQFLNELYLNQSIEANLDNAIYLTTIHGSKGLEWDYVYLIDVDSDNFPKVNHGFFKSEGEEMEEERRLFYVACSRAKHNLVVTYNYNLNPSDYLSMSPFIREVDVSLYTPIGMDYQPYQMTGVISQDVNNYLKYFGFSKIYPFIKNFECTRENIHNGFEIPKHLDKFKYSRLVIGNFIDFLIAKMIQINFTKNVKKFELNIVHKLEKFPQKIRQNYIDELNDWRNLLDDIFFISTYNIKDDSDIFNELKTLLINPGIYSHYNELIKNLTTYINKFKPVEINSHYNVSHANIRGEIDLLVDDTLFEIKTNQYEIATTANLTQTLMYAYLVQKKNKKINNIILYNPLSGEITKLNTENVNFKEIATIIYSEFKSKTK
jgi:DNA helicase-2/ATP-dependent DNA helicase PcrA